MIDTGESTSALGRVRAAVAGAVELGLKKKAAILAKALHQINAARQDGFSHAQIHVAITSGGLDLTPAYYEKPTRARCEASRAPGGQTSSFATSAWGPVATDFRKAGEKTRRIENVRIGCNGKTRFHLGV